MKCPYCHQETEETAAFCTYCGRYIPRCPTCGEVITARIRFCMKDGTPIPEDLTRDLPEPGGTVVMSSAEAQNTDPSAQPGQSGTGKASSAGRQRTPVEPYQQPSGQKETPKKSGGSTAALIVATIAVVVIALAIVLWVWSMLGQSDGENDEGYQTSIVEEDDEGQTDDAEAAENEDETVGEETEDETEQIDVSLTTNSLTIYVGMTHQIIGANADQVSWTYSEPGIVEVDSSGKLTAYAAGTTVATATGPNGETDSVDVTVLAAETEIQEETDPADETGDTENTEDTEITDISEDYVLPESGSRYLEESELVGLTAWECRVARNEIYARHGMIFTTDEMKEYFSTKSWYEGTTASDAFDISVLNEYELANIELIAAYEKEMGYNQTD